MSRVRVLRIIARMNVGGPALQVTNLVRGMDPVEFDHRLLVGDVGEGEEDYLALRAPDLPVQRVTGLGRAVRLRDDLAAYRTILRHIRTFRPHIVHTHTAKAGLLGRLAAWQARVPHTVHTFHGHLLHGYFSRPVTLAVRLVERLLAMRTSRLVAVGAQVRDELIAAGIGRTRPWLVVPPGVALPPVPPKADARVALGLEPDDEVVAFVARFTPVKRPERVIELAAELRRSRPRLRVVLVGEGPLTATLRTQAEPAGDTVRFLGWRGDVETVYAAADLVVLTSDNEGMPVSLIEASLCGCPAVATRVGSVAEVVIDGQTGLLIQPGDAQGLREAVERLLDDSQLREQLGRAAAAWASERFSASRLVGDLAGLYRELMAAP